MMRQLVRGICWVCSSEDASSRDNPKEDDGVIDVVDGVEAYAVAWPEPSIVKAGRKLTDQLSRLVQ